MDGYDSTKLRYHDARARGQFLRGYFNARGIDFEDERIPLDEGFASWLAIRDDRSLSGPLQRLPVLHYGDRLIPETLVIANFVHRTFGDAETLSDAENLQHEVLLSSANIDLMMPIAMLIWGERFFEGIDMPAYARNSLGRISRTLDVIDNALVDWNWVANMNRRPVTVADCMFWEELDQAKTLFASALSFDDKPRLEKYYEEYPARDTFEKLLSAQPCQITGRPGEAAAIETIRSLLS